MNTAIAWRGKSRLDGKPILLLLVGLGNYKSRNTKTGGMIQSYILVDGMRPLEAIHTGNDFSICGDCPLRGDGTGKGRGCYVALHTGLNTLGKNLSEGKYQSIGLDTARRMLGAAKGNGKLLRIGTYGDPAAVPPHVWRALLASGIGWTGYTHQSHQTELAQSFASTLMASVGSEKEYRAAKRKGWRTFRVRKVHTSDLSFAPKWAKPLLPRIDPLLPTEVMCPASKEAGKVVQCEACKLCQGTSKQAKDVAIIDHSTVATYAKRKLPMVA